MATGVSRTTPRVQSSSTVNQQPRIFSAGTQQCRIFPAATSCREESSLGRGQATNSTFADLAGGIQVDEEFAKLDFSKIPEDPEKGAIFKIATWLATTSRRLPDGFMEDLQCNVFARWTMELNPTGDLKMK